MDKLFLFVYMMSIMTLVKGVFDLQCHKRLIGFRVMVLNATFNNISVIS
jgi:hypothetical protein